MKTILIVLLVLGLAACASAAPATATPITTFSVTSLVLSLHTDPVTELAWSPDGGLLASAAAAGSDFAIRLWDADGRLIKTLSGHTAPIHALAWSPDGRLLASGSADQTVRLWKSDGSPAQVIEAGKGIVFSLAWSPDGTVLASGSIEGYINPTVQLWKPDGTLLISMNTKYSGGKFYNLVWSPDGQRLLGGATDYKVWRPDGSEVWYFPNCEHCAPAWGAAWSPDSTTFAIGDENGAVDLFNRDGRYLTARQSAYDVNTIAWSPDGELLAAGRDIWKSDGSRLAGVNGNVTSVAWSVDGQILAVAADKLVTLVRADGTQLAVLRDHGDLVNRVAWSPAGLVLASASDDRTIRLWNIQLPP